MRSWRGPEAGQTVLKTRGQPASLFTPVSERARSLTDTSDHSTTSTAQLPLTSMGSRVRNGAEANGTNTVMHMNPRSM